jgi:hypothetical protein
MASLVGSGLSVEARKVKHCNPHVVPVMREEKRCRIPEDVCLRMELGTASEGEERCCCSEELLVGGFVVLVELTWRWVFCSKNLAWNDVKFTRSSIETCCGLHNFLEGWWKFHTDWRKGMTGRACICPWSWVKVHNLSSKPKNHKPAGTCETRWLHG